MGKGGPRPVALICTRLTWDPGKSLAAVDAMADSGATLSCIAPALADAWGLARTPARFAIELGVGSAPADAAASYVTIVGATIDTLFGPRPLKERTHFLVVSGLSNDMIIGLDALQSARIVVDTTLGILWCIDDIAARMKYPKGGALALPSDLDKPDRHTLQLHRLAAEDVTLRDLVGADISHVQDQLPPPVELSGNFLDVAQDSRVQALLASHSDIFGKLTELPPRRGRFDSTVDIDSSEAPTRLRNRLRHPDDIAEATEYVKRRVAMEWFFKSNSPWAAPLAFAKHPTKAKKKRAVFDFRSNNTRTPLDPYRGPTLRDIMLKLRDRRYKSTIDLSSAYNQMRMREGHEQFAALITHEGIYSSRVAMLGMKNAGLHFQRLVDAIIAGDPDALPRWPREHARHEAGEEWYAYYQGHSDELEDLSGIAFSYSDDIIIATATLEEHYVCLEKVFQRIQLYGLKCNEFNTFAATRVKFLGFEMGDNTKSMLPSRVEAIQQWPEPTTPKEIQSFLGVVNFCRDHVPNVAIWSSLLTPRTRGVAPGSRISFTLNDEERYAFNQLKHGIAQQVELFIPDLHGTFIVVTDASVYAIGGILLQHDRHQGVDNLDKGVDQGVTSPASPVSRKGVGRLRIVAYYSRQTTDTESRYGQYKRELVGLCACCRHFLPYLEGSPVIAYSDCEPLVTGRVLSQSKEITNDSSGRIWRMIVDIQALDIDLRHHPATAPLAQHADALSRRADYVNATRRDLEGYVKSIAALHDEHPDLATAAPSTRLRLFDNLPGVPDESASVLEVSPPLPVARLNSLSVEAVYERLRGRASDPNAEEDVDMRRRGYEFDGSHWRKNGRLVVPDDAELRGAIIDDAHLPAHRGCTATGRIVAQRYYWPHMYEDVRRRLRECSTCQQMKPKDGRLKAPILPRTPPSRAWEEIEIDFIPNLPPSGASAFTRIVTVVDTYSKMAVFWPTHDTLTSDEFGDAFLDRVWKRFGMPKVVRSDVDTVLVSAAWRRIAERAKFTDDPCAPFRHEANGAAERANQTIESLLRALIPADLPDDWAPVLPVAEFLYNATPSAVTGISPFVAAGYREPRRGFGLDDIERPAPEDVDEAIARIDQRVKDFLSRAEAARANRIPHALERFRVGEWAWLSTNHVRAATGSQDPRLRARFIGPYRINAILGPRTYELDLPARSRLVNRIDVDRLKRHVGPAPSDGAEVIANEDGVDEVHYQIDKIIRLTGRRTRGRIVKTHAVVQWQGYDGATAVPLRQLVVDAPEALREFVNNHPGVRLERDVSRMLGR